MQNEETTLSANGQSLHVRRWLPDGRPAAVVVIVHGFAEHGARYGHVARRLTESGYAVVAFDLRGHGRSSGPRALVRSIDEYLDDLRAVLDDVGARLPGLPVVLLGHSMGGMIVPLLVIRDDRGLAGVVLSGPALRGRRSAPRFVLWLLRQTGRFFPRLRLGKLDASAVSRDPDVVARYDSDPLVYRRGMPAGTLRALIDGGRAITRELERIALPLLIVHGTEDQLTDPEGSRQLLARASSRDKTLKLYEGLYHEVLNEPEKDTVLNDIAGWLDARVGAASERGAAAR